MDNQNVNEASPLPAALPPTPAPPAPVEAPPPTVWQGVLTSTEVKAAKGITFERRGKD